jgi:3-hydroxyisobutyrate dehydrogenase
MTLVDQIKQAVPQVAVLGAGTMGAAMARRLLDAGTGVQVWSRHTTATMPLVELGATAYDRAADAAHDADVVITMLPTVQATAEVMFGAGALRAMRHGAVWVQMATIGVEETDWFVARTRAERPDVVFVDAPVSGSRAPAETGQLLILASGPKLAARRLESLFDALGRATLWLGEAGAGSRMKLVLNTWLAFQTEGAAEAAALAESLGVPTAELFRALSDNPLASPYALSKLARMVEGDYRADFALDWALKDLDLVATAARADVAPVAAAIAQRWRGLVRGGSSGLDVAAARLGLGQQPPPPAVTRAQRLPAAETESTAVAS